jgi:hypothetical protein
VSEKSTKPLKTGHILPIVFENLTNNYLKIMYKNNCQNRSAIIVLVSNNFSAIKFQEVPLSYNRQKIRIE